MRYSRPTLGCRCSLAASILGIVVCLAATACSVEGSSGTVRLSFGGKGMTIKKWGDGVCSELKTDQNITIINGEIKDFPAGTVIEICEERDGKEKKATLREDQGELVLWIRDGGEPRLGTDEDRRWLKEFLSSLDVSAGGKSSDELIASVKSGEDAPVILEGLQTLSFSSDRAEVLTMLAGRDEIPQDDQVHLVDATLDMLSFSSEQVDVLLELIRNPCFSDEASKRIVARIDELSFDSNRKKILKELLR